MTDTSEISAESSTELETNSEAMSDKERFDIELRKFYANRQDGCTKPEWTKERINIAVASIQGFNSDNVLKQPKHNNSKEQDYYDYVKKRENYLKSVDYFMAVAKLAAQRSKDPDLQVGACLVTKDNKIISIGYNGMPIGCSDDDFPWGKGTDTNNKHLYVCHAEMNAIVLNENPADLKTSTLYVTLFPCNECAKVIIQAGIPQVVYLSDEKGLKKKFVAAKKMFDAAKIKYTPFEELGNKTG